MSPSRLRFLSSCAVGFALVAGLLIPAIGCGGSSSTPPSSGNLLASLTTSLTQPMDPTFDPATTAYAIGPAITLDSVVVTPTAQDAAASITVNGMPVASGMASPPLPLSIGMTTVTVVVTAADGSTKTYTIAIDRTSAALTGLTATAGDLAPAFDPMTLNYTAATALFASTTTLTPTAEDPAATIEVNTVATPSGTPSADVVLTGGMTPVTVVVTARDGTTTSTYTVIFDRSLAGQQAYIKASNAGAGDWFGLVAISGDTLVVGARQEDSSATGGEADNSAPDAGAAYVFVRDGTSWSQQAYLKASNAESGDEFGSWVAISGDTVVVGAPGEDSSATAGEADNSALGSGAAYVFVRTGTTWSQQAYLKASNAESPDAFGFSVAIAGDTLVVGAPVEKSSAAGGEADNSAPEAGAAYVFVRSGTTWTQQAYLKASNAEVQDFFGAWGVAIAGDTVVVGARQEDSSATGGEGDNSAPDAGAAYVFVRSGTTWSQQAYLKASNAESGDEFGFWVAIAGDTVVVGADGEDSSAAGSEADNSAPDAGAAYVFVRSGTTWSQQAYLKASNAQVGDAFGIVVAIAGDTVVVGAPGEDSSATDGEADNSTPDAGAAYVFVRTGTAWSQLAHLKASNAEGGDQFGAVAISGDTVVVGAPGEDSSAAGGQADNSAPEAGAAYVYR